ncbi:MAG TPA: SDR family oxidoreductase [Caulobacterales bacterium]|nr:SDR family oxidoreductase [Caulobacterales bacterium]
MDERLKGKVALVIGAGAAAGGWSNGKAAAVAYARAGASVAAVDLDAARAGETVALIEREGGEAFPLLADATKGVDVAKAVEAAQKRFGRIDIVHNNVGVGGGFGAPDVLTEEGWKRELSVTLDSAFLGIKYGVPALRESGGGAIINISSTLAVRLMRKCYAAYTVAKAGVEALTRSCALAYGPENIRVNCIRIGFSETPLMLAGLERRGLSLEERERELAKSRAKVPLRHEHTTPWEIAAAAVFLASDEAKGVTGVVMNVDGGVELAPI